MSIDFHDQSAVRLYCATWVLPICATQIPDGAVAVSGNLIAAIGPRAELIAKFPDAVRREFPGAALIPGLINCHAHLELSALRGFLEQEEAEFPRWLRKLTAAR
ncbi:MAG: hypothetical protein WKF30_06090, partial [Pyrinomonadaceae bacterium]